MEELDLTAFMDEFRAETAEHLRALDAQLLKLERDPADPQPVREMFLSAHTIKGSAALLDLADVRALAHAMEDVLASLRDERRPLDVETADTLFWALDTLRRLVDRAVPGAVGPDATTLELVDALRERAGGRAQTSVAVAPAQIPPTDLPRVLLVEDSATVRLLETMLLTEAGFQVDAVADGQQALALALAHPYRLVVTGIETRGLRGLDLAVALRDVPACHHLPIIVISSDDNPDHRRRAADLGVQAYIRKGSLGRQRLVETARELATARMA